MISETRQTTKIRTTYFCRLKLKLWLQLTVTTKIKLKWLQILVDYIKTTTKIERPIKKHCAPGTDLLQSLISSIFVTDALQNEKKLSQTSAFCSEYNDSIQSCQRVVSRITCNWVLHTSMRMYAVKDWHTRLCSHFISSFLSNSCWFKIQAVCLANKENNRVVKLTSINNKHLHIALHFDWN